MTRIDAVPSWIPKEWKHIKHGQISRYLGIPFGLGVPFSDMWNWFLNKFKSKLYVWENKYLSLAGKI